MTSEQLFQQFLAEHPDLVDHITYQHLPGYDEPRPTGDLEVYYRLLDWLEARGGTLADCLMAHLMRAWLDKLGTAD